MKTKKTIAVLLVSMLSICLFFVFGFQIDVTGGVTTEGGTADVILDPSKVAADLANAAIEEAELALEEALEYLSFVQTVHDDPEASLLAAQTAVTEAEAALEAAELAGFVEGDEEYDTAALALKEAEAALLEVQALYDLTPEGLDEELEAALKAVEDAEKALEEAILAVKEANEAYSGGEVLSEEELAELQKAVDDAKKALEEAEENGLSEEEIEELEEELEKAEDALKDAQSSEDGYGNFHIVTNSNNGGSFNIEGIYFGTSGEIRSYSFTAEEGYELAWLRIGNTKVYPDELGELNGLSFERKNLTMHAHFQKIKDYDPEEEITTTDEGNPEEGGETEGEEEKGKGKDNGNGKGKDKEKSNNGKKKK
jgi:tetratricopeptide (TPR) repeat protein